MNAVVSFLTPAEKALGEQFRLFRQRAEGAVGGVRRDRAFAEFSAAGLPHRRIEAWHYTDLRSILREALPPAMPPDSAARLKPRAFISSLPEAPGGRVTLLDGHFAAELSDLSSLPAGVTVRSALEAFAESEVPPELAAAQALGAVESVLSLNSAFLQGGVSIEVAAGCRASHPTEILFLASDNSPAATYTRSFVSLGGGASASVVERHASMDGSRRQDNHALIISLADEASLDHVGIVTGLGVDTVHVGSLLARLGSRAKLLSSTLIATGGVTRRQAYLEFAGPSSQAHFRGVSLLDGRSHADTTLIVTHTAPSCESRELYKHILDGQSTGVYQGKVVVAPGAQKTDGKMLSKAVFLDEGASMFNKPELEIFADDVVCGHGATAGSLDEDQLFYLRARAIPLREAQALLLEAFADEAIEDVADEALRTELTESVSQWLRQRGK